MRYPNGFSALCAAISIVVILGRAAAAPDAAPVEIRVVVVTAFEIGEDTGDTPGEFQAWAEELPETLPFPLGFRHLRYDPRRKILAISTGTGTNRAATSTLALGLDPRFDFSHAYWLVAAIAGVNPDEASTGSAAWIGDVLTRTALASSIHARFGPDGRPAISAGTRGDLSTAAVLPDNDALRSIREPYAGYPNAVKPTFVLTGEVGALASWRPSTPSTRSCQTERSMRRMCATPRRF